MMLDTFTQIYFLIPQDCVMIAHMTCVNKNI